MAAARDVAYTVEDQRRGIEVWLVGFGDSSLDFELVVWVDLVGGAGPAKANAAYLWALETELGRRGIEIPFPSAI